MYWMPPPPCTLLLGDAPKVWKASAALDPTAESNWSLLKARAGERGAPSRPAAATSFLPSPPSSLLADLDAGRSYRLMETLTVLLPRR